MLCQKRSPKPQMTRCQCRCPKQNRSVAVMPLRWRRDDLPPQAIEVQHEGMAVTHEMITHGPNALTRHRRDPEQPVFEILRVWALHELPLLAIKMFDQRLVI